MVRFKLIRLGQRNGVGRAEINDEQIAALWSETLVWRRVAPRCPHLRCRYVPTLGTHETPQTGR